MPTYLPYKKLMMLALCLKDPAAKVRIYTIQQENVLNFLNEPNDYICGSKEHRFDCDFTDGAPYAWMQKQMHKRLESYSGDLPIWAWPKKPDMRQYKHWTNDHVRIIAEVPLSRVLMSDFDLWHCVLNNQYLALTEKEWNENENATQAEKELSWERIFKFGHYIESKEHSDWLGVRPKKGKLPTLAVQLCVDRLYKHEIISIKHLK